RDKLKEDPIKWENYKLKNKERMQNTRPNCKTASNRINEIVDNRRQLERIRKSQYRQRLAEKRDAEKREAENDAAKKKNPYKCKQTLGKAVRKIENALPRDLEKKVRVLEILLNKFKEIPQKKIT
ncbi:hypothetical protein KR215_005013, partial [Drosophila sulfurigaster]